MRLFYKKLCAVLLCALLTVQPIKPTIFDTINTDTIYILCFFIACAICGHLASRSKKSAIIKKQEESKKPTNDELKNELLTLNSRVNGIDTRLTKHDNNLPTMFNNVERLLKEQKNKLEEQKNEIELLKQKCNQLKQQQVLLTIKSDPQGYVPAFVAFYWYQQAKTTNNYKQNTSNQNSQLLLEYNK